tara:strand:+ start:3498 stop:4265 length:768 start_codon:yes stop_codon:yes gene_type:complete
MLYELKTKSKKLELYLMEHSLPKSMTFCFSLAIALFSFQLVFSQENTEKLIVNIVPSFNGESIIKDTWYVTQSKDSIQLSKLKFYATNFVLMDKGASIDTIKKQQLVDIFKKETLAIELSDIIYTNDYILNFDIGVDETLNTSGANAGDLDPINGMFWSWQSGYINFKIEGKSPSCNTRKNKFQFHIGGYQKPNKTIRTLVFNLASVKGETLTINLEVDAFFESIYLASQNQVMIPGKEASSIANLLPQMFSIHD